MLSFTGFLTICGMGTLLVALFSYFLEKNRLIATIGTGGLVCAAFIVIVRLLISVELGFERSIRIPVLLPQLYKLIDVPFITIAGIPINICAVLCITWAVGGLVYFYRSTIALRRFKQTLFICEVPCDATATNALHALYEQRKSRARFRLLQTPIVSTPLLIGVIHPIIV